MLVSLKKFLPRGSVAVILKSTEAGIDLVLPMIMADIIDNGVYTGKLNYILQKGSFMVGLATVGYISAIFCNYFAVTASQGFGADLRERIYTKIQNFNMLQMNKFSQSSLITRLTKDVNQVVTMFLMSMRMVLRGLVTGIGAIIFSFIINPKLATVILGIVSITIFLTRYYMKKSMPLYSLIQKKLDGVTLILRENLLGIRVIKALSKEKIEERKFDEKNEDLSSSTATADNIMDSKTPFISLLINSGIVMILWFGGIDVSVGTIRVGEVIAIINYLNMLLFSMNALSFLFSMSSKTMVSGKRINEILKEPIENIRGKADISTENILEFREVYFKYGDNSSYAIENINFNIARGEKVAIIGGIGSGKTTLIDLIPRFYEVTEGAIYLNGKDIRNYSLKELRSKIAIVLQKSFLFSQSIEENMRWAKEDATAEEIQEALKISQGAEFVEDLPEGSKTKLSKGGNNLSGGQKQRLSIARTILKDSEILIFDDSFSALDFLTEGKLKDEIKKRMENKTIITISQRVSSIVHSDKIIVLDRGRIVGIGTHGELIEKSKIYKEICQSQEFCAQERGDLDEN